MPFDVYTNTAVCTLTRLDGKVKRYDLFGQIFRDPPDPFYVEVKNYTSAGGKQPEEYWEFLANAYSITAQDDKTEDARRQFAWVTLHPFEQTAWSELTTAKRVAKALKKHPEVLAGEQVNPDLLSLTASRLWLLVLHERQTDLMLTSVELAIIEGQLNRKGRK